MISKKLSITSKFIVLSILVAGVHTGAEGAGSNIGYNDPKHPRFRAGIHAGSGEDWYAERKVRQQEEERKSAAPAPVSAPVRPTPPVSAPVRPAPPAPAPVRVEPPVPAPAAAAPSSSASPSFFSSVFGSASAAPTSASSAAASPARAAVPVPASSNSSWFSSSASNTSNNAPISKPKSKAELREESKNQERKKKERQDRLNNVVHATAYTAERVAKKLEDKPIYVIHVKQCEFTDLSKEASSSVSVPTAAASSAVVPMEKPWHLCQITPDQQALFSHDLYGIGVALKPIIKYRRSINSDIYKLTGQIDFYRDFYVQEVEDNQGKGFTFRFEKKVAKLRFDLQGRSWVDQKNPNHGIPMPNDENFSGGISVYENIALWTGFPFKGKPLYFMGNNLKVTNLSTNKTYDVIQEPARHIKRDEADNFVIDDIAKSGCVVCPHNAFYNRKKNLGIVNASLISNWIYWWYGTQFDVTETAKGIYKLTSRSEDWHTIPMLVGAAATAATYVAAGPVAALALVATTAAATNLLPSAESNVPLMLPEGQKLPQIADDGDQRPLLEDSAQHSEEQPLAAIEEAAEEIEAESPKDPIYKARYDIMMGIFDLDKDSLPLVQAFQHKNVSEETTRLWGTYFSKVDKENVGPLSTSPALRNLQELEMLGAYKGSSTPVKQHIVEAQASIISTGGAWGIDFNRTAEGEELRIMLRSLKSIGQETSASGSSPDEMLKNLATRLIQKSATVRTDDISRLIEHQTLAFIMAANYAGEIGFNGSWADVLESEAAQSIANCANAQRKAVHQFDQEIDANYVKTSISSLKDRAARSGKDEVL